MAVGGATAEKHQLVRTNIPHVPSIGTAENIIFIKHGHVFYYKNCKESCLLILSIEGAVPMTLMRIFHMRPNAI